MAMTMGIGNMIGTGGSTWAATAVEKATSELLIGPDWTINIDICDSLNSHHSQAKDVVKAVKKRLLHKNPRVQLLALTLLETMVKNCGDYVHFQIADKNLLGEMVKIVRKKADMHVRDKILVLLDSWQEAFGGPGGKHPEYYWAYEELRRVGVDFPRRSPDAAPIFTPPVVNPARQSQAGYGMPSNSSRRLDETMAADVEGLSLSSLDSMRNVMELLSDMLQAVNPGDREAVKDEVIIDLADRCRSNQKKLMQMVTTTGDEELLGRGLELNDSLQTLLAKHDAIASGSSILVQATINSSSISSEGPASSSKPSEVKKNPSPAVSPKAPAPTANSTKGQVDEDEEEEDEFAQLARRHHKPQPSPAEGDTSRALVPVDSGYTTSSASTSSPATSNALALSDPPVSVKTSKEQDIFDLLSTLSTTSTSPHPHTPPAMDQDVPRTPPAATQGNPYVSQTYQGNQSPVPYNNYVAPWAQPQKQHQFQPSSESHSQPRMYQSFNAPTQQHFQSQSQAYAQPQSISEQQWRSQSVSQLQPQVQPQSMPEQQWRSQSVSQLQPQVQPQVQSQYTQYPSAYPPPPWAATPGYANSQNHAYANHSASSTPLAGAASSYNALVPARPLLHNNSFSSRENNVSALNATPTVASGPSGGQKPFIPSYRLFEDLNVFGNGDGKFKMSGSTSPSLSGPSSSSQGVVGGRK